MKKVLVVIGTRPEAIKLAPVVHALAARPGAFETAVCLTGQHREMLAQAVDHFDLPIAHDLGLMRAGQTLAALTAALVTGVAGVVERLCPHVLLVQGDTTTAFAASLVAYYNGVEVGHVEAGLRSGKKRSPFPEEMNRRLVSVLADHHFAPTERARRALLDEGIDERRVLVTGNTVIDALFYIRRKIAASPPPLGALEPVVASGRRMVLITGHRRESFGEGFQRICEAIRDLSRRFAEVAFVYPVHLNPNVQEPVRRILGGLPNVHLGDPLSYLPFVRLMEAAHVILTDSGGIQEEAPSLGKPVLVMREVTERPEGVEAGNALLVGTDRERIVREVSRLLEDESAWQAMARVNNPYGDGRAAERIAEYLAGAAAGATAP
jgi:UDP-N-acetylglucosamine 2-epimerase (non-hydrolysing)